MNPNTVDWIQRVMTRWTLFSEILRTHFFSSLHRFPSGGSRAFKVGGAVVADGVPNLGHECISAGRGWCSTLMLQTPHVEQVGCVGGRVDMPFQSQPERI